MKYSMECPLCLPTSAQFTVNLKPSNDGFYEVVCPMGHKTNVDILCHHFQFLFDNAIEALHDEYYIESLSSFAATYERFMEFFIGVVSRSRGVDSEEFKKAWKQVSNQSERQLGAFIFVYLKEFNKMPGLLSNKYVELRNKVIHKGHFPNRNECIEYGDSVLSFILPKIKILYESDMFRKELIRSVNDTGDFDSGKFKVHVYVHPMIGTNRPPETDAELTIEKLLERMKKVRL